MNCNTEELGNPFRRNSLDILVIYIIIATSWLVVADAVDSSTYLDLTKYGTYENLVSSLLGCRPYNAAQSGAIQVLRNADGVEVSHFLRKGVNVY